MLGVRRVAEVTVEGQGVSRAALGADFGDSNKYSNEHAWTHLHTMLAKFNCLFYQANT